MHELREDTVGDAAARPAVNVDEQRHLPPGVAPGGVKRSPQISMPSKERHYTVLSSPSEKLANVWIHLREPPRLLAAQIHHDDVAHRSALDAPIGEPPAVAARLIEKLTTGPRRWRRASVRNETRTIGCSNMCAPRPNVPSLASR